jgi:predicted DCC family thiol-disulfide oxidoreductase YuxK
VSQPEILLVYDAECPVCDAYCRAMRSGDSLGSLRLINARDKSSALMQEITHCNLDIDQGMVVKVGGVLHYGADAIEVLAHTTPSSTVFGRINRWLFSSHRRSKSLYPLLRSARNLLLKALGKTKINNLQLPNNERF